LTISILLVDDDPAVHESVAADLERAGYAVQCAGDAAQGQACLKPSLPGLVLLDWDLPGMSGIEFARRLRADNRTQYLPIIMISERSGEFDKIVGLDSGADDYVTKPFSARELKARIKAVLRQPVPGAFNETITASGLQLDLSSHRVSIEGGTVALGKTEFRLLHFLMARAGRTQSRAQILSQVWGHGAVLEERAVDVYIRRLRKELEKTGRSQLIDTVRGEGYRFCSHEPTRSGGTSSAA
jgi:two-component system phosphate regulon response regulator PhoB